jgi:hypothetical protein
VNDEERALARTATRLVAHTLAGDEPEIGDEDVFMRNTREFAVGFACGCVFYDRRGEEIAPEELYEVREIVYDESSRMRAAMA